MSSASERFGNKESMYAYNGLCIAVSFREYSNGIGGLSTIKVEMVKPILSILEYFLIYLEIQH